jgi:hypothetical protein
MSASPRPKNRRPTVGLDTPCRKCGRPIYFNYRGPVEGLCGRCTDGSRKAVRFQNSKRIGFFRRRGRAAASTALFVAVLLALLGFVGYLIYTNL